MNIKIVLLAVCATQAMAATPHYHWQACEMIPGGRPDDLACGQPRLGDQPGFIIDQSNCKAGRLVVVECVKDGENFKVPFSPGGIKWGKR